MKKALLIFILILAALLVEEKKANPVFTIGSQAIKSYQLKDTTLKIAWREEVYDSKLKQTVNYIVLNDSYFSAVTDPEKAAIGYIATFIGNECRQDGENVKCKILTALNLGYQCSESNKEFLKKWFSGEPGVLGEIESCKSKLSSSASSSTFDKITVTTKDEMIKVKYSVISANVKENKLYQWNEELTFSITGENLDLIKHTKKKK